MADLTACQLLGSALTGSGGVIFYLWRRTQTLLDQAVKREHCIAGFERERAAELQRILMERVND